MQTTGPSVILSDYLQPNETHHFFWDLSSDPSSYPGWVWTFTAYPYSSSPEFPALTSSVEIREVYFLRKGQELGTAWNELQLNIVVRNNGEHPVSYELLQYGVRQ